MRIFGFINKLQKSTHGTAVISLIQQSLILVHCFRFGKYEEFG